MTNYQLEEIPVGPYRHLVSERAISGETMLLNMGPQHPSTHGVLRLLLELDGEIIINCIPDIGYLHTGIEKNMEAKTYLKAEVMCDRLDYMNPLGNNLAYCLAVEKLVELDVPPRAQALRVILVELQRVASHLVWLGTFGLDLAAMSVFLYCFRERERHSGYLRAGHRSTDDDHVHPPGRSVAGCPGRVRARRPQDPEADAGPDRRV